MKKLSKSVLAMTAFAAFGASAQTVYTGAADQERRDLIAFMTALVAWAWTLAHRETIVS